MTKRVVKHTETDDVPTGMPGVTQAMLTPDYWLPETMSKEDSIPSAKPTKKFTGPELDSNHPDFIAPRPERKVCAGLFNLATLSEQMQHGEQPRELQDALRREALRAAPNAGEFYDDLGQPFDSTLCQFLKTNARMGLSTVQPRPGFTLRRADVRTWPTEIRAFRSPGERELDRFQETKLHTFEAVLVLSESEDGLWYLIVSQTYVGWVRQADVALTTWPDFDTYLNWANQVIIAAPGMTTQAHPYDPAVSLQPIEFGAYLPQSTQRDHVLGQQSPIGNAAVLWPVRTRDGLLEVHTAFIPQKTGVQTGILHRSRSSLLQSAFRLLFERYGWGDLFYNHDCSSYVMDVYRTIGIQLPRNTGQQEHCLPHRTDIPSTASLAERRQFLQQAKPGDLLFMPGHVMLYLGERQNRFYILHDFVGYTEQRGEEWVHVPVNEVMISPLDLLTSEGISYFEALTSIVSPLSMG